MNADCPGKFYRELRERAYFLTDNLLFHDLPTILFLFGFLNNLFLNVFIVSI